MWKLFMGVRALIRNHQNAINHPTTCIRLSFDINKDMTFTNVWKIQVRLEEIYVWDRNSKSRKLRYFPHSHCTTSYRSVFCSLRTCIKWVGQTRGSLAYSCIRRHLPRNPLTLPKSMLLVVHMLPSVQYSSSIEILYILLQCVLSLYSSCQCPSYPAATSQLVPLSPTRSYYMLP